MYPSVAAQLSIARDTHSGAVPRRGTEVLDVGHPDLIAGFLDGTGPTAHRNAVAVNAGAMFYLNSRADSLREGTELALRLLEDGTVQDWITTHEGTDYSV